MALFSGLRIPIEQLANLTQAPLNAYDSDGGIVTLYPQTQAPKGECYYIVDKKDGRKGDNILVAKNKGIGRDNIELVMLYTTVGKRIRVYPMGE